MDNFEAKGPTAKVKPNSSQRYVLLKRILLFSLSIMFFIMVIYPYMLAILMGAIFAFATEDAASRLKKNQYLSKFNCTKIVFGCSFGLLLGIFAWAGFHLYSQVLKLSAAGFSQNQYIILFQENVRSFSKVLDKNFDKLNMKVDSIQVLDKISEYSIKTGSDLLSNFFTSLPDLLLSVFIFSLSLYFFTTQSLKIKRKVLGLGFLPIREVEEFISELKESSYTTVTAAFITGIIQAVVVCLGSIILRFGDPLLVFTITFIFSFIPVIGAAPVALALAATAYFLDSKGVALGFFILSFIAGTIDNVIRPFIVSNSENNLHPVVVLIAILGGLSIMGLPGLFIAPVVVSLAFNELPKLVGSIKPGANDFKNQFIIVNKKVEKPVEIVDPAGDVILVKKTDAESKEPLLISDF